jgi:hypothetical protein
MAPKVVGTGPIDPKISAQFSKAQASLIWPGLDYIVRAYMTRQGAGSSRTSYPFQLYPPKRGFDTGTFSTSMMNRVIRAYAELQPKTKAGGQFILDVYELRAAAFAARVTRRLHRLQIVKPRKKGRGTLPPSDRSKRILAKQAAATQRVVRYLERLMKRANRRFIRSATQNQFRALSKEWQSHLRWMQFNLAYFKPAASLMKSLRPFYQNQINCLVRMAEQAISDRRLQLPSAKSLRHTIRLFLNYSRRGRIGRYDLPYMLKNSDSPFARTRLFEFLEPRLYLKRAS